MQNEQPIFKTMLKYVIYQIRAKSTASFKNLPMHTPLNRWSKSTATKGKSRNAQNNHKYPKEDDLAISFI